MAEVLAAAVRDRQRVPDEPIEIEVDHEALRLDRYTCEARPGPGTPVGPAAQPGPAGLRGRGGRRARRPGGRADRHRPVLRRPARRRRRAGRSQPARRGRPGRHPPRPARRPGGPGRARPSCGRCSRPQRLLADLFASDDALGVGRAASSPRPSGRCCAATRPVAGRRRTCRCWTRRPNCSARTTARRGPGPSGCGAARAWSTPRACWTSRPGSRSIDLEDEPEAEILTVADLLDAEPRWPTGYGDGRAADRGGSGPPPTGGGRSGTSSWTRRRSSRRWRGGC